MSHSRSVLIYYFSGTGNAMSASRWIAENACRQGLGARIRSIDRFDHRTIEGPEEGTLLGFAYPTHGFLLPWFMLKFLFYFPRGKNQVFLLNTRAGMKIANWNTPGLSGLAILFPILILILKGYRIRGVLPLDMPSNWISLHPGLFPSAVDFIVNKCHGKVNRFSTAILNNKSFFPWYFFFFLPLDLAVAPISFLYFFIGRFFLSKTFFASKACNSCKICSEYCPVGAIRMIDERPYWTFNCESCMRCMNICPQQAIETSHSMAALIIIAASSIPIAYWLQQILVRTGWQIGPSGLYWIDFFLSWLTTLVIVYLTYILMFAGLRNSWVSRFFLYTSLTYYWARYKAPGISLKDFKRDR